MNKQFLVISVASFLLALGCAKESEPKVSKPAARIGVSLAEVQTRTSLGPNADESGKRPVYWSEGDIINVNGFQSMPLTADQAGKQTADFFFYSGKAPYSVIYPASVCEGSAYGDDGMIEISIPSVQEYSATSFGKGAAVLYGYGEEQPVSLHNLCGAVRVTLNDPEAKITKAVLLSNGSDEAVAGTFRLDTRTGEYTVVSGIGSISLDMEEVVLGAEGQSFYFTLPNGKYPHGFTFRFYDEAGGAMECRWLDNSKESEQERITVAGGKLYEFKPVGFKAGGLTILAESDWIYIAEQIKAGSDAWKKLYLNGNTNTVRLGDDIVLSDNAPAISAFDAVLDGCNHTITRNGAVKPLVETLGGCIRNLIVAGDVTSYAVPAEGEVAALVPFVDVLDGGRLEKCPNKVNITIESCTHDAAFAGFVKTAKGGTISGCVNEGNISVVSDCLSGDRIAYGGGFVASVESLNAGFLIDDCNNNGAVTLKVLTDGTKSSKMSGIGGFIGRVASGDKEKFVTVKDCDNAGEIRDDCTVTKKAPTRQYSLGGIVGVSAALLENGLLNNADGFYIVLEGCSNKAQLTNNMVSGAGSNVVDSKVNTGGIVGCVFGRTGNHALIKDCENTGDIVPYIGVYPRQPFSGVCGGLVGTGGLVDIQGGQVNAVIGTTQAFSYANAGIIGVVLKTFSITGVKVSADVRMVMADTYTNDNFALAVTNHKKITAAWRKLSDSEITGCEFSGSYTVSLGYYNKDAVTIPAAGTPVSITEEDFNDFIVSKSYTGTDIKLSDNKYLTK